MLIVDTKYKYANIINILISVKWKCIAGGTIDKTVCFVSCVQFQFRQIFQQKNSFYPSNSNNNHSQTLIHAFIHPLIHLIHTHSSLSSLPVAHSMENVIVSKQWREKFDTISFQYPYVCVAYNGVLKRRRTNEHTKRIIISFHINSNMIHS